MSATLTLKSVSQAHGRPEWGHVNVNPGKVLPASTTGNLFVVSGVISCSLIGIVSTVFSATAVSPTIGVTGSPAAIAAAPSVAFTANVVGSVLTMPTLLGGNLPALLTAQASAQSAGALEVSNTTITITTGATNTGAITWVLVWASLFPKHNASVTNS